MRDRNHVRASGGIGVPTVLFIVFLVLKLTNVIDWSWWWVTAPLWISVGLGVLVTIIYIIVICCSYRSRKRELSRRKKRGEKYGNQRFTWR